MLRMAGQDAAFLYGETPEWHMHVSSLVIADPTKAPNFSFDLLKQLLLERLPQLPQFRWKVVDIPLGLDRPGWVEADNFEPDYHVRRIAVPSPGGKRELGELVGRLASYKLDTQRPLWEMWVIEGLADGRIAVLTKIHHAIIDGVSGAGLGEIILDITPEPREASSEMMNQASAGDIPGKPELLLRGLWNFYARTPVRTVRFVAQTLRQGLTAAGFARHTNVVAPYSAPRTSMNGPLTAHRAFASARIELDRVKRLRQELDVKVNDIVLELCASALRGYFEARGEVVEGPLVVQCPVSLRTDEDKDAVGNRVGSMFTTLATDLDDPLARLRAIHQATQNAKEMQRALSVHRMQGLTDTTPPGLIALAARMYSAAGLSRVAPPPVNLVVSNVPGPPFRLYMAGAPVEEILPMGPLLFDMGLNITVLSYCEFIDFGLMSCPALVPEPAQIADRIPRALEELEIAAGLRKPAPKRRRKAVS